VALSVGAELGRAGIDEQCQHVTDGPALGDGFVQWQMCLDLVAAAPPVTFLDDVTGGREVGDNPERPTLADAYVRCDLPQADSGVARDGKENPRMVGKEAPILHPSSLAAHI
jgi:hypothetical protein